MNEAEKQARIALKFKKCTRCGKSKLKIHFYKNATMFDGHARRCRECELTHKSKRKPLLQQLMQTFGGRCFKCKGQERLTVDHHMPISKGGGAGIANCVLLCIGCNSKKHHKTPQEFYTAEELQELRGRLSSSQEEAARRPPEAQGRLLSDA
jgi:hypothetical protein